MDAGQPSHRDCGELERAFVGRFKDSEVEH